MERYRKKGENLGTRNKYLHACYEIKNKCDNKIAFNQASIGEEYNTSSSLITFLIKYSIIRKTLYGLYEWNEKIPVTNKLITSYINYTHEANKQSYLNSKVIKQKPTLFNSPHYIKDAIKGTVTVVPEGKEKEFIKRHQTKRAAKQTVESENLGLIRRFIKWIY